MGKRPRRTPAEKARAQYTNYAVKEPMELMEFLAAKMPDASRTKLKSLLSKRVVFVDNVITTQFNFPLEAGMKVKISKQKGKKEFNNRLLKIVYEDAYIIVVEKMQGLLSVNTERQKERTAYTILNEYVQRSGRQFRVFIVHRLDRDTSGLMMFAKDEKTQRTLRDNWHEIVTDRRYVAVVEGSMEKDYDTVVSWLTDKTLYVSSSEYDDERLNRDEAEYYLEQCKRRGYNVIQVQTLNNVPSMNIYGQYSMIDGYNFKNINQKGVYGYWDHMDYIIRTAAKKGQYIGMVCIWGSPVNRGEMTVEQAKAYGKFLAERYKDEPNIIWFIGGDIRGDVKTAEWEALATSIKAIDKNHLMTFHPRGRTTSATWFNNAPWLDFNMFQSGHRRYGQRFGDGDYPIEENTEEDNWRFVERSLAMKPMKPVIDGEPIYEEIPHGLHDENELLWKDYDVRRYAYWSVFAGSFGHTYGHNSIMQFIKPGVGGAYGAKKPWYDALNDPGYNQMKYLKNLMLTFPFFERIPDQSIITGQNGERYDRAIATRGNDYLMVYNYTGRPMEVDFSKISGAKKNAWWYTTKDGKLEYIGEFDNGVHKFQHDSGYCSGNDHILIVVDSSKNYVEKAWTELPNAQQKWAK